MPIQRPLSPPLAAAVNFPLGRLAQFLRWVYNLDGATNRAVFANRLLNPDGDIDIEWRQAAENKPDGSVIVSQCGSGSNSTQEFRLTRLASGDLEIILGGAQTTITAAQGYSSTGRFKVTLIGSSLSLFKDSALVHQRSFTRGAVREPSAVTSIGARPTGASSFTNFFRGTLYDVRINGVLYPLNEANQTIQLPWPRRLGAERYTTAIIENPPSRGSQWTYLGDGRWRLTGDGTYNELIFLAVQPPGYLLEFEIESISGGSLRCFSNATQTSSMTNHVFNAPGVYRFVLSSPVTGAYQSFVRHSGTINCVIKNISLRPLWVTSETELVTNGNFNNGTTGWSVNGSLAVNSGQGVLTTTAGQNSRFEQALTLETGAYYEISCDLVALSGVSHAILNFRRGASSGFTTIFEVSRTSAGRISFVAMATGTDAMVQVRGDATNAGTVTVDNISVRKLNSLCTPLTLVNTTSPGWQQVDAPPLPLLRWVYNFDGVDDFGSFSTPIELGQSFDVQITVEGIQAVSTAGQDFIGSELNFKFGLDASTGRFSFLVGNGSSWAVNHLSSVSAYDGKRYVLRATKIGNTYTFTINGEVSFTAVNVNAVTPRVTHIARRTNNNSSWARGRVFDAKINGVSYSIDEPNQTIQLPSPSGLGNEVLLTNTPFLVPSGFDNSISSFGSGFSVTKGTTASRAAKAFSTASVPSYLVEFNLDSVEAGATLACFIRDGATPGNGTIITSLSNAQIGKNRLLFSRISGDANILFVSSVAANFTVSGVSVKQLGTCNPLTLSNTTSPGWQEIEA